MLIINFTKEFNNFIQHMNDIKTLFFATEVPQQHSRPHTQQIQSQIRRSLPQQQTLQPFEKLKRMKDEAFRAKRLYHQTLSDNHRLQLSLTRLERKKYKTRAEFIKIYGNLKYKKFLQDSTAENETRAKSMHQERFDRTKKKKLEESLQHMLIKNQQQQKIQTLQKKNRKQKEQWVQIKHRKTMDLYSWSKSKHDVVKSQNTQFVIRKTNISSLLQERSKVNYMKKINKQLQLLKEYENVIDDIEGFNILQINKFTDMNIKDEKYDTFFMTTKNTIS